MNEAIRRFRVRRHDGPAPPDTIPDLLEGHLDRSGGKPYGLTEGQDQLAVDPVGLNVIAA